LKKASVLGVVPNADLTNQSAVTFNDTISKVLLEGITNGEKLINMNGQPPPVKLVSK
jgi:hypothetical protein